MKAEKKSCKYLLDAYLDEKNSAHRSKYRLMIPILRKGMVHEVIDRFEYCEPRSAKDLFEIIHLCSESKAHLVSKQLMHHSNPQIRWEALKGFKPADIEEMNQVLLHFKRERHDAVKKQAALVLLETENKAVIDRLFKYSRGGLFRARYLLQLVELCGNVRSALSFEYLCKIFNRKPIFNTIRHDRLRAAAITSLARLRTKEAMKIVREATNDRRKRIREASHLLLELKNET